MLEAHGTSLGEQAFSKKTAEARFRRRVVDELVAAVVLAAIMLVSGGLYIDRKPIEPAASPPTHIALVSYKGSNFEVGARDQTEQPRNPEIEAWVSRVRCPECGFSSVGR
jgi:hypothetical protein